PARAAAAADGRRRAGGRAPGIAGIAACVRPGGAPGSRPAPPRPRAPGARLDRAAPPPAFARQGGGLVARVGAALGQLPGGRTAIAHDITDLATARDRLPPCRKIAGFPWQRVEDALEDAARAVGAWP